MQNQTVFILIAVLGIVCGIIMREIAKKRRSNLTGWFIVGLVLGPISFIFIPFIRNKRNK